MKKNLFLLVFYFLGVVVNAQTEGDKESFLELGTAIGLGDAKNARAGLNLNYGMSKSFYDRTMLGLGIGLSTNLDFETPNIPIFARGKYTFTDDGNTSFFGTFDLGYSTPLKGGLDKGNLFLSPNIGLSFGKLYLTTGIMHTERISGKGSSNFWNFSIGTTLGGKNVQLTGLRRFFSRTNATIETGYGFGISTMHVSEFEPNLSLKSDPSKRVGDNISARFAWTYQFTSKLEAGIGVGGDLMKGSPGYDISYDGGYAIVDFVNNDGDYGIGRAVAFIRGKYTFWDSQLLSPFVQLDLGSNLSSSNGPDTYFLYEPAVGFRYKTGESKSINISLSPVTQEWNYDGDAIKNIGSITLRFGYTF